MWIHLPFNNPAWVKVRQPHPLPYKTIKANNVFSSTGDVQYSGEAHGT
jgi:hypothetical protein